MDIDMEKWSHRATPLLIATIILTAPAVFLPDNWMGRAVNTLTIVPIMGLVVLMLIHGKTFCEYCAADTPADGLGTARRKSRSLKFYHRCISKTGVLYLAALVILPSLLPQKWPSFIAWAALQPGLLTFIWFARRHNILAPWCPWCNGGDDGLREPSPDPVIPQKV